jgi:multidrug efflux pump
VGKLRGLPELQDVTSDQQNSGFATEIIVDRDAATRLGVTMQSIEDVLYDAFGQRQISTIFSQSNQYRVVMEADPSWVADPGSLARLRIPGTIASIGANGAAATASTTVSTTNTVAQVPLSAVARIERRTAPLVITHQAQFPSATISFNLRPGVSLGTAVPAIQAAEQDIGLPETVSGNYAGDAAEFQRSLAAEPWLILAAVAVIYIVLGVLYESFIHPITIISTLPSAGIGALLALMLFGADLSIVALVGIVLLMGIVKKNGILVVDFALEAERTRGISPEEAAVEACILRFRPIMMTTAAALLGSLPLVLERGTGSELRWPLGVAIVGGLLLSQVITLYTTPSIYVAFERLRRRSRFSTLAPAE